MTLFQIDFQPDFPEKDISDTTAATLEKLLKEETLETSHEEAERHNLVFKVGHPILDRAAQQRFDEPAKLAAFSGGITTYEAMSSFVRPQMDFTDREAIARQTVRMGRELSSDEYLELFMRAKQELGDDMPRTSLLIAELAIAGYKDYAISGAALARQNQLNIANDLTAFEF